MCGIFGYVGRPAPVGEMVLGALKRLEYRGYDSWGVAAREDGHVAVQKATGKIGGASVCLPSSAIGFGHTRWATHGGVTVANAHPHLDCTGRLALIHNGIVENFRPLRDELAARGHDFRSDTDSEVIVHLVEEGLAGGASLADAVRHAFARLHGLNAIIAMDVRANELVAVKNISPLIVGLGRDANYVASDTTALIEYTRDVVYLDDHQVAVLRPDEVTLLDAHSGAPLPLRRERVDWDPGDAALGGYPDYMSKEMAEQGRVVRQIAAGYGDYARLLAEQIWESYGTFLVGCGTASYAALTGMYLFSRIARRHVNAVLGSEFKYQEHFLTDRSFALALSQSGETADIIEAMVTSRARGAKIGALVNVRGSTLDRMADLSVPLGAGPEQCVLSTKAYVAKLAILTLTAHTLAGTPDVGRAVLTRAAAELDRFLQGGAARVREVAERIQGAGHLYTIGRGLNYPTALEAALKIKEVSYLHAEGFAGGELKHGVIALVERDTPCLVFAPCDETRDDILSGAMEMKSRGGFIVGVSPADDPVFDVHLPVADVGDASPIVNVLPAQLLGYHLARLRGHDPDKPRNLAKSVTVK
ncbi:MAG TPA: glutamine--fructose-6-phosphate transaminase (isomerizing) [Thermomicrobiales bacterium]|nr:glutamine--fructose-6-phosphate transaminase (isomerizing) [Thermomicrobiales bacterium]